MAAEDFSFLAGGIHINTWQSSPSCLCSCASVVMPATSLSRVQTMTSLAQSSGRLAQCTLMRHDSWDLAALKWQTEHQPSLATCASTTKAAGMI
jgi:hypothetical protein